MISRVNSFGLQHSIISFSRIPSFRNRIQVADQTSPAHGSGVTPVLRLFPKTREEWRRAFLFVFQSYPVLVFVARNFYRFVISPHGKGEAGAFYDFEERVQIGCAICLIVLFYSSIIDLIMGHWRRGCLNLCLAFFSVWLMFFGLKTYAIS